MMSLTFKQAELLGFIAHYQEENGGVSPSFQEMMEACQLNSKSGVHRLISALQERGRIRRPANRARCIEIIPAVETSILDAFTSADLLAEIARRAEVNRRAA